MVKKEYMILGGVTITGHISLMMFFDTVHDCQSCARIRQKNIRKRMLPIILPVESFVISQLTFWDRYLRQDKTLSTF